MTPLVATLLSQALAEVVQVLERHAQGIPAPLSSTLLAKVKEELETMQRVGNPDAFKPTYPRFVLDWPDETGLVERLCNVAYVYGKQKETSR